MFIISDLHIINKGRKNKKISKKPKNTYDCVPFVSKYFGINVVSL